MFGRGDCSQSFVNPHMGITPSISVCIKSGNGVALTTSRLATLDLAHATSRMLQSSVAHSCSSETAGRGTAPPYW